MQFVKGGPDIPERLLQDHEDGRVVFFCGAGISYPARLPDFEGLVQAVCVNIGHTPNAVEQAAIEMKQFDTAIGLIEQNIVGGRTTLRREIAAVLQPDYTQPNATRTHESLLLLAKNRIGKTRLITTNFDRIFEDILGKGTSEIPRYRAPYIPVPKNRFDGLVYLHGLLSDKTSDRDLDNLIVSSGDFGLAYLVERWASRFVSELFRNFTVCFVGYSINDPVLRYMTDALSADKMMGESPPEMFLFGAYEGGSVEEADSKWRAKSVTPILYDSSNGHESLHITIHSWASTYRDGVNGKCQIISQCSSLMPMASTKEDDFVGRVLWSISDRSGRPAKTFAEMNPPPAFEWLEILCENRFSHSDLDRFGIHSGDDAPDRSLSFSIVRRPSPHSHSAWMCLTKHATERNQLDDVLFHLTTWFVRYLDEPRAILWISKNGGSIHEKFSSQLSNRIRTVHELEESDKSEILNELKSASPNGIPRKSMRTLWRLALTGLLEKPENGLQEYDWRERFICYGLTASLRLELKSLLSPRVLLRPRFQFEKSATNDRVGDIVDAEVVLRCENLDFLKTWSRGKDKWDLALSQLIGLFVNALHDVLDLHREIGQADDDNDYAYFHRPYISPHPENDRGHSWCDLIEFILDSWNALKITNQEEARIIAHSWMDYPYPVFKRLAFHVATVDDVIPTTTSLRWITKDNCKWMHSPMTRSESMQLIVFLARKLEADQLSELMNVILSGPQRELYRDDILPDEWQRIRDRDIWNILNRIVQSEINLTDVAGKRLADLNKRYPQWISQEKSPDSYLSESGWGSPVTVSTPANFDELVAWLKERPNGGAWNDDDWSDRCKSNFDITSKALIVLATLNIWHKERWSIALRSWNTDNREKTWTNVIPILLGAPDDVVEACIWWLKESASSSLQHEESFYNFCDRGISLPFSAIPADVDTMSQAINHPIGYVVEAILQRWFATKLHDGARLPTRMATILSTIIHRVETPFRCGRLLLSSNCLAIFRVDPVWFREHLLPIFDWKSNVDEARYAWCGFLWSPRLFKPLIIELKDWFIACSRHYKSLNRVASQYARLVAYIGLDPDNVFASDDIHEMMHNLPREGLIVVAETLSRALDGAEGKRAEYWVNRVEPFFRLHFPKDLKLVDDSMGAAFAEIVISAGPMFAHAFDLLRYWIRPARWPDRKIKHLIELGICEQHPHQTIDFLVKYISDKPYFGDGLKEALNKVLSQDRSFEFHPGFVKLKMLVSSM